MRVQEARADKRSQKLLLQQLTLMNCLPLQLLQQPPFQSFSMMAAEAEHQQLHLMRLQEARADKRSQKLPRQELSIPTSHLPLQLLRQRQFQSSKFASQAGQPLLHPMRWQEAKADKRSQKLLL
jgi:hypothetical protein